MNHRGESLLRFGGQCQVAGLLLGLWAATAVAAATPTPHRRGPDGFGKAKFGMTIDAVRKRYPALTPARPGAGAAYFHSPHLARYLLTNVKVPGLTAPANLELRFWKNRLWTVIIYYSDLTSEVMEDLYRRYGEMTSHGVDPTWVMANSTIMTAPSEMWYSIGDNGLTKEVQQAFAEALQAEQARIKARTPVRPTPTALPRPPATPN